jgi:hypothetical protein
MAADVPRFEADCTGRFQTIPPILRDGNGTREMKECEELSKYKIHSFASELEQISGCLEVIDALAMVSHRPLLKLEMRRSRSTASNSSQTRVAEGGISHLTNFKLSSAQCLSDLLDNNSSKMGESAKNSYCGDFEIHAIKRPSVTRRVGVDRAADHFSWRGTTE